MCTWQKKLGRVIFSIIGCVGCVYGWGAHFLILLLFSHNNVFKRCGFKKSHFYFGALYQVNQRRYSDTVWSPTALPSNEFTVAGSGSGSHWKFSLSSPSKYSSFNIFAMLCKITHVTMIMHAFSGWRRNPDCKQLNLRFNWPMLLSTEQRVVLSISGIVVV